MIKPVTFRNHGQKLIGILHIPIGAKRDKKTPGIVMFHGFTGNGIEAHRLFVQVARSLCNSGFVVLRFDFRDSGNSDGNFEDMTIPGEADDAEKALTFIVKQPFVNKQRVGVIGLSMGGRVAAILASKDKRVRFAVLYSAALEPLKERFLSKFDERSLEILSSGEAVKESNGWYLKRTFYDTVDSVVPIGVMDKIRVPVLIVHSDMDQVVPIEGARKGYDIIRVLNSKNEFYIVRGGDHTFSERDHTQEVITKTTDWLLSL